VETQACGLNLKACKGGGGGGGRGRGGEEEAGAKNEGG